MNDLLFGILTILLCTLGYAYSWKQQIRNNYGLAVFLLMVCGFILRFYTASDFFLHNWDERFHALVARNLILHPFVPTLYENPLLPYDYTQWTANHIWLHKQPLPLWAMAASIKLFGVNEIALRLPSILLSTLGIGLTFVIGRYLFNEKTAFFAAFLYSVNGLIIELSGGRVATDHYDIFMLFFVELGVFFSLLYAAKKQTYFNVFVGLSIGAALLSKWLPALIVLPVWLMIMTDAKIVWSKIIVQLMVIVLVAAIVAIPWQIYIFSHFPLEAAWETSYNVRHFSEVIENHAGDYWFYLNKIRINYGELIYLPLVWFFYITLSRKKDFKRIAVLLWFLIPFLFFSYAKTKMQGYILFTAPALFLITADFFTMLKERQFIAKYQWLSRLILLLLIALPVRYSVERVKPFSMRERNPQWVLALKKMNEKKIQRGVLFNYNRPIEAMFYTDFTVYPVIPTEEQIEHLVSKGYTIMINNTANNVPDEIKNRNDILIENLPQPES